MSSSHQPYNTPNTAVGTNQTVPYQHWLDDAANMGLMLYRMRNDSKRERLATHPVARHHQHHRGIPPTPPPPPPPNSPPLSPLPVRPLPVLDTPTPRSEALQIPTVATASGGAYHPQHPMMMMVHNPQQLPSLNLPLD